MANQNLFFSYRHLYKLFFTTKIMESYEQLLDKAYESVKVVEKGCGRFEIPKVTGEVSGNSTYVNNIGQLAAALRRPVEHLAKFLHKELAVSARVRNTRCILKMNLKLIMHNF